MIGALVTLLMIAGSASAASFSDADGDGVVEPGEEVNFEGDTTYIDENGITHYIQEWYWDFDSDGNIDADGQFPTHTYDGEGNFVVTLHQLNAGHRIAYLDVEVKNNEDPEHDCKDWDHIKRFIQEHPENKNKLRWILKKMDKLELGPCDC
jgi:hypothetical protein